MSIEDAAFWYHRHNPEATKDDATQYARKNHAAHVDRFVQAWSVQRKNAIKKDVEAFRSENPSAKLRAAIAYASKKYDSKDDVIVFRSIFKSEQPRSITQSIKFVDRMEPEKDEDDPENMDAPENGHAPEDD